MNPANSIAIVLDRVGNPDMAKAFAGVAKLLESTPESEVSDTYKALERSMDLATQQTLAIINNSRVASLASNLAHWWKDLPDIWNHRKVRLNDIWAKVTAEAVNFLHEFDGSLEPVPQFISLREEQADEDYVARLHYLAGLDGNLRLLFMAADDPDIVYVADVMDEDAVSALLSPYPVSNWKSPGSADYVGIAEFTVHVVNGHRIFRTDGLIASCDLGALQVLQSGEFLPRMASLKTASVTRLTFTMNAMMDPCFRDFLRSMGGVPASVCSWDIPIHQEADIPKTLEAVKSQFGYSVMMYQVIDTPEQNIYASASPEGQVVRMLSAEIAGIRTGSVETADMGDVAEKVRAVTASVSGTERHALEKIAKACSVHSHYLVARTGEIKPSGNRFLCDITKLFANTRTEAAATKVYVFPGTPTQIVAAGVMDLDKNGDGTIDAIEMGTLGLMSDSDSASEPLDDSCPHGHCPKCSAEGDCVEGNDTICVDGHRSKTSAWKPCTCGPVVEAPEARVAGSNISNMTRQYAIKHDASFYVDTEDGLWHVFGDNTGFSYNHFTAKQDAENLAKEMNDSKTASTRVAAGPTNARDAFSKDKSFYVEIEDGVWHVFGDNTGFSYRQFYNEESADDYAEDMNKSKARVAGSDMSEAEARKLDTGVSVQKDPSDEWAGWNVVGNETGFSYFHSYNEGDAETNARRWSNSVDPEGPTDRSTNPNVVEYARRTLTSGKRKRMTPKLAAEDTAKKFSGFENMFFGPGITLIDAKVLEDALWDQMVDKTIAIARDQKEPQYAAMSTLQGMGLMDASFKVDPKLESELKKRTIAKLGTDPFSAKSARVAYAEDHDLTKDETDFIAKCVAEAIKSGLTEVEAIEDFVLAKVEGDLSQEWAREEENTSQLVIDGLNFMNAEAKRQLARAKTAATAAPLTQKERVAINASLAQAGFDGNKNFKSVSAALSSLMSILNSHGLELDEVTSADIYNKPTGHRSINVARSTEDPFSPESLQNTSVAFSWAPRGDSEFVESVAYLG